MINDVTDAFGEWLESVSVTRDSEGAYIDGRYKKGDSAVLPITAVIQNTTPDDLIVLDEGLRTSESIKLHTTTDLVALDEKNSITGDKFPYKGKSWEVVNVARRYIGAYHKAIAIRVTDES